MKTLNISQNVFGYGAITPRVDQKDLRMRSGLNSTLKILVFLLVLLYSITAPAQKYLYLNNYYFPIYNTPKYQPQYYQQTIEKDDSQSRINYNNSNMERDAFALLGKDFDDPDVQEFMGPGMNQCAVNSAGSLSCPLLGVELSLRAMPNEVISQVRVYITRNGQFRPYAGPLPFNISRQDTRAMIISKLGIPEQTAGNVEFHTFKSQKIKVGVSYKTQNIFTPPIETDLISNLTIFIIP